MTQKKPQSYLQSHLLTAKKYYKKKSLFRDRLKRILTCYDYDDHKSGLAL